MHRNRLAVLHYLSVDYITQPFGPGFNIIGRLRRLYNRAEKFEITDRALFVLRRIDSELVVELAEDQVVLRVARTIRWVYPRLPLLTGLTLFLVLLDDVALLLIERLVHVMQHELVDDLLARTHTLRLVDHA